MVPFPTRTARPTQQPDAPEELLSTSRIRAEVAKLRPGIHPSPNTIVRWARKGVRGKRLNLQRVGTRNYVTRADLKAFLDAITTSAATAA
jgi:hypothetical protein